MDQRVIAPYQGYFIAVYACPMGELGERHCGHYKIFARCPTSYWDEGWVSAHASFVWSPDAAAAMKHAEALAKARIRRVLAKRAKSPERAPGIASSPEAWRDSGSACL